jgi:hypothetical protein
MHYRKFDVTRFFFIVVFFLELNTAQSRSTFAQMDRRRWQGQRAARRGGSLSPILHPLVEDDSLEE